MKDPYGNLFQVVQDDYIFKDEKKLTAGVAGATIGVTDIDRAMTVYRDILGYDTIVADETGTFPDLEALPAGTRAFRRRLLTHSKPKKGSFSQLFGPSTIELVQALDRTPKKLYEGRFWGDPGFIQVCFDIRNMEALGNHSARRKATPSPSTPPNGSRRATRSTWAMPRASLPTSKIPTAR
jgi:hypothetical protein